MNERFKNRLIGGGLVAGLVLLVAAAAVQVYVSPVTVPTVADMQRIAPHGKIGTIRVLGIVTNGDAGQPIDFRVVRTNLTWTNMVQQVSLVDSNWAFIHDWNGRVEIFGAVPQFISYASTFPTNGVDCLSAFQSAIEHASLKGGGVVQLSAGTYWISDSINLKPNVTLRGVASPNGFSAPRRTDLGYTGRVMGSTYIEMANADGVGKPCVILDGPSYYTNQFTQTYINLDGDLVAYRSGANTIENITFSVYQWGWGSTSHYPVAGIVIHDVDGVTIRDCGFSNIAGHGIWGHGARGLMVKDSNFGNCISGATFLAYTSDARFIGNLTGGSPMLFYKANSVIVQNNEIWNPLNSLVSSAGTTNIAEWGISRPYNATHPHRSDSASDYMVNDGGNWAADTGTMLVFEGSSPPSPFIIGRPYFAINGTNGATIKLADSPFDAMAGTAIDILSNSTNGAWKLTGYDNCITVYGCEETIIQNNRMDQSYQDAIRLEQCVRPEVTANSVWEVGANMQPQRLFRVSNNPNFNGVFVKDSTVVGIKDNQFTGGYMFGSNSSNVFGVFRGAYVTNSFGVLFSGNTLSALNDGIFADAGSRSVYSHGNVNLGSVGRIADSANTNGINSMLWDGLFVSGTNPVVSSDIPNSFTNLNDFTLRVAFKKGTPQIASSGDSYEPIINIGSTTNYSGSSVIAENSLRMTLIKSAGSTNWALLIDLVGTNSSFRRATVGVLGEHYEKSGQFDLIVTRTNGLWQLMRNGVFGTLTMVGSGATPPNQTNAIHAKNVILGIWPLNLWRNGWYSEVSLKNVAYSYTQMRDYLDQVPGANQVFLWDFRGDSGSTIRDKSGNGVSATVTSLNGSALHAFGMAIQ